MKAIKYYDGRNNIEIEVSDEVVQIYQEIKRDEWRQEYYMRTKNISADVLSEAGFQFEAGESNLQKNLEEAEDAHDLYEKLVTIRRVLKTLSFEQQRIITLKFYRLESDTEISKILGITRQAVQSRLETIFKKIRKTF